MDTDLNIMEEMVKHKALFETKEDVEIPEQILEPTIENLKAALSNTQTLNKEYKHPASGIVFKIRPMSSEGYTAIRNVEKVRPDGTVIRNNRDDEKSRAVILLTYGVAEPVIAREDAEAMLKAPAWGPSNELLLREILRINPAAEILTNEFILVNGAIKFLLLKAVVEKESGLLEDQFEKFGFNKESIEKVKGGLDLFVQAYDLEDVAKRWDLPFTKEELEDKPKETSKETTEEELEKD